MKIHVTENEKIRNLIRKALKDNNNYCPCVPNSKGNIDYLCPCKELRENIKVGQSCHCGLYIKEEE